MLWEYHTVKCVETIELLRCLHLGNEMKNEFSFSMATNEICSEVLFQVFFTLCSFFIWETKFYVMPSKVHQRPFLIWLCFTAPAVCAITFACMPCSLTLANYCRFLENNILVCLCVFCSLCFKFSSIPYLLE